MGIPPFNAEYPQVGTNMFLLFFFSFIQIMFNLAFKWTGQERERKIILPLFGLQRKGRKNKTNVLLYSYNIKYFKISKDILVYILFKIF